MKTAKIVIDIKESGDLDLTVDNRDGLIQDGHDIKKILEAVLIKAIEEMTE